MMADFFGVVLTMSLTAAVTAAVVMLLRPLLKRLGAPKPVIFLLWVVVLFRMVCPLSFESPVSLLGLIPQSEGQGLLSGYAGPVSVQFDTGVSPGHEDYLAGVEGGGEVVYPDGGGAYVVTGPDGASPPPTLANVWMPRLSAVWLLGAIVLCLYALISYLRLKRRVSTAIWAEGGLWETDQIDGPFVLGFFPPKIYLPLGLSGATRDYVVLHERTHIRRIDHIIKALFFLALTLHWFNPVLWLAWVLACRDMEAACDESLLKDYPLDGRKRYSTALLTLASVKPMGVPLAFGENDVKNRIKDVLKEKRPAEWLITCCVLLTLLTGYALTANPIPLPQQAPALVWERGDLRQQAAVNATSWENLPTITSSPDGAVNLFFSGRPNEVSTRLYSQKGGTAAYPAAEYMPPASVVFLTLPDGWPDGSGRPDEVSARLYSHSVVFLTLPDGWPDGSVLVLTARWRSGINTAEYTYTFRLAAE